MNDKSPIVSEIAAEHIPPSSPSIGGAESTEARLIGPAAGLILAAFTVYLSFNAGGFFPGADAYATTAMAVLLIGGIMLAREPLTGSPPALLACLLGLAGFAAVTLLSGAWSDSWSRSILEFDRALLYLLALAFFSLLRARRDALEWGIRGLALAAFIVCAIAWITRVAPDLWPIGLDVKPQRLSFPLTYWNALGLLSALGAVAMLHLTSAARQARLTRILGAAALPLLLSTLLLTFSRSSLALVAVGFVAYLILARPRHAITGVAAVAIPAAIALIASLRADTVSSARYTTDAGISQGHHLALIVIGCVLLAAVLRFAAFPFDLRLDRWMPPRLRPAPVLAAVAGAIAVVVVVGIVAGGPGWVSHRWDSFVHEDSVGHTANPSERLSSVGNNGRIPQWKAAVESFEEEPLLGNGAGTYALQWALRRPYGFTVVNAHSLYVEVMGELGIVGLILIVGVMISILVGAARRLRGPERGAYAAFLALGLIWMLHAGIDWDWQMPAVTIWLFALAGLGLGRPVSSSARPEGATARPTAVTRVPRLVAAICIGVLAVTPVLVALSQTRLESAFSAFEANECPSAIGSSLDSISVLGVRPEPYEIIGYCDIRLGQDRLAERSMESAISRDPENWEMHYGLAMVRGVAGRDPLPELRKASRLNPLEPLVRRELQRMEGAKGPAQRRQVAERAGLPL